jgi:hypothetical protein
MPAFCFRTATVRDLHLRIFCILTWATPNNDPRSIHNSYNAACSLDTDTTCNASFFGPLYSKQARFDERSSFTYGKRLVLHVYNTANTVTLLHQVEGIVDLVEGFTVGDELINLELAVHVVVNEVRKLGAALDATKGAAFPYTARDQLEC